MTMTPQELMDKFKAEGIDLSKWLSVDEKFIKPVALEEQRALLVQLRDILEGMVEQDRLKVLQLKEQVARLQHGGGA
jgi:hypothetical protein